jgi:hypothetical protein
VSEITQQKKTAMRYNPTMPEKPSKTSGVYFMECAEAKAIKIGYAVDVVRRRDELQCGNPFELRLLAVMPGVPRQVERDLHSQFGVDNLYRNGGWEWFRDSPTLRQFIASHTSMF